MLRYFSLRFNKKIKKQNWDNIQRRARIIIKRAENSVRFECNEGSKIQNMINQTIQTKERINKCINVKGFDVKQTNVLLNIKLDYL